MSMYEIRVCGGGHARPYIFRTVQLSDFAAVRKALAVAEEDEKIEVWKGMDCIYERQPGQAWRQKPDRSLCL